LAVIASEPCPIWRICGTAIFFKWQQSWFFCPRQGPPGASGGLHPGTNPGNIASGGKWEYIVTCRETTWKSWLKGFQKLWLEPGERATITFDMTPGLLSFHGVNLKCVVEPGDFEMMVGSSSRRAGLQKLVLQVAR
jgi:hypothetical protein